MKNLGKLIKYDFMDVSKLIIPFYIGMGVMGIVIRVFWFILLNEKIDDRVRISTGVFQFMSYFGYVIAIIGIILMTYYAVIIRYYRSIYGNEGYLTNTLPIETYEIILAKLLTFFSWFVVNGIIIFFTFWFIIPVEGIFKANIFRPEVLREIEMFLRHSVGTALIIGIISMLVMTIEKILFLFLCVSIANMVKSYRILTGIGAYIILGGIIGLIKQVILTFTYIFDKNYGNYDNSEWEVLRTFENVFNTNLGMLFTSIVFSVILFFVVNYLLKNKLNLE
ncbi:hypothetical protein JMUB3935_0013 [Leptotrichia trevisanii]|uniref:Uncharacterized protein n=1 Tax=Leptotrichia trevisanii TaxID=109328 RepID=A0A510KHE4_9FUSO|nr:hypothetical protein [Leptotrichia trevisanii]BBM51064.1 hypothetical protein JMUB3935_0013 [Leptotrichia trevisanii]